MRWMRSRATEGVRASAAVTEADVWAGYRLLLGREPDAAGLRDHLQWAAVHKATPTALAERLMASDEYRRRMIDRSELVPVDMGGYVVCPRRGDQQIGAALIQNRSYEPHLVAWFDQSLHPGAYVIDIGANIGIYTMRAAARVGATGKVVAVEPLPQNHQSLYAGIVHNGFHNIEVMPFAASDRPGLIPAICASDSSNGIVGVTSTGHSQNLQVPTCRLDDLLGNMPRLDLVKIDIEGHEPVAWKGIQTLVQKYRPDVVSEFSPVAMRNVGQDPLEYLRMLFALEGRVRVVHRDTGPVECGDADSVMTEWAKANQRAGLDGVMHLDLHIQSMHRRS